MSQLYTTITSSLLSHQVLVLLQVDDSWLGEPEGNSRLSASLVLIVTQNLYLNNLTMLGSHSDSVKCGDFGRVVNFKSLLQS